MLQDFIKVNHSHALSMALLIHVHFHNRLGATSTMQWISARYGYFTLSWGNQRWMWHVTPSVRSSSKWKHVCSLP